MLKSTQARYGSVAKFLHWVIFLLVFVMLCVGFFMDDVPKPYQGIVYNIHKLTGLTILTLMLIRVLWTLTQPKPALPLSTNPWEKLAERSVHGLLYVGLLAMPVAGWIGVSAAGHPAKIGSFALQLPVSENKALADQAFYFHNTIALVLITLISIHVLAALFHHFIKKDNVLKRMLP